MARDRQKRLEAWLDEGMALVAREGLDALTLQRLAHTRNRAVSGVYRYFDSKASLVAALQGRVISEYEEDLIEFLEQNPGTAREILEAAALHYHRWLRQRPGHLALINAALSSTHHVLPEAAAAAVMVKVERALSHLARVAEHAPGGGRLVGGKGEELCRVLWASVHGVLLMRKLERLNAQRYANDPLMEVTVRALITGWIPGTRGASP